LDSNYFNYVQPYETHWTTPSDGINMYSFSLFPEEQQPSGSANLSRLSRITLFMEFVETGTFRNGNVTDPLIIRIYTRNLNILRIVSGMGGIAFVYG
jgi:Large eukaryotic DNA virus major capsid protein